MPLGVRMFQGGLAHYRTASGRYVVDDDCWLILNVGERYTLDLESPTPVRSLVAFFPAGWADLVAWLYRERPELLLDESDAPGSAVRFLEATVPHDETVSPQRRAIAAACRGQTVDDTWLEERLGDLLAAMLLNQRDHRRRAARLPAARSATREELYRRLCRGREFVRAEAWRAPALAEAAAHASLSPYHFQRAYTACFGESPHATARRMRLDQAERLLRQARQPAGEIAAAVGYESYGAFSTAFVRRRKTSPTAFRKN
jgi:AraC-like DNA-binding protein